MRWRTTQGDLAKAGPYFRTEAWRRAASEHRLQRPVTFGTRRCDGCGQSYTAVGHQQRFCRECVPNKAALRAVVRYGLTPSLRAFLLTTQKGRCVLCAEPARHVDHDHTTGRVRGLLCRGCNGPLGWFEKGWRNDPDWVGRVISYLERGR